MPKIAPRRTVLVALVFALALGWFGSAAQSAPPQGADQSQSAARRTPPMQEIGTNSEGWTRYRLAPGRVPDRLQAGLGFRGEISWEQGGLVRQARVYIPGVVRARAPMLIALPGLATTLAASEQQQGWSRMAYQQKFVLVWGMGYEASFNGGFCCGAAAREGVDDLAYLDRVIQVVGALQSVDRRKVSLAGFSNGAMLAYRYACGRPGRISGVLAVAGTMTAPCTPHAATAIMSVHGEKDTTVPLAGMKSGSWLGASLPPARRAADLWRRTGAGVRTVVVPGFGHGWPTRADGYDTTGEGWRFLIGHPLPR